MSNGTSAIVTYFSVTASMAGMLALQMRVLRGRLERIRDEIRHEFAEARKELTG
jgi:hypothetical protein